MGGSVIYGHNHLKYTPKTGSIISLCTDALLLVVCNNLLGTLSCKYDGSTEMGYLIRAPEVMYVDDIFKDSQNFLKFFLNFYRF